MGRWISVVKRLPEQADKYLVCVPGGFNDTTTVGMAWYFPETGWMTGVHFSVGGVRLDGVTHWMRAPKPPKGE